MFSYRPNRSEPYCKLLPKSEAPVTTWTLEFAAIFLRSDGGERTLLSGAYGIRTRDLLNAIEALYQLS